jgi:hypothetical protein
MPMLLNKRSLLCKSAAISVLAALCCGCKTNLSYRELEGTWIRTHPDNDNLREGFTLNPDGTAEFVNMYSWNLLTWNFDGKKLLLITNTDRYPEPHASPYRVRRIRNQLRLSTTDSDYLVGTYTRAEPADSE